MNVNWLHFPWDKSSKVIKRDEGLLEGRRGESQEGLEAGGGVVE